MLKKLQILNWLGLMLVLVINTMANALPINGYTTGELSELYPNLFVPAGFTFSIWGVIYLFLIGFAVYQSKGLFSKVDRPQSVQLIGLWFFLSCLANAGWIFLWHFQLPFLALVVMVFLLLCLITIYRNLGYGQRKVSKSEKWLVQAPFSLYLGWISVATIANTTAVLVEYNFSGWGLPAPFWAAAMIMTAGLLALFFLNQNFDFVYAIVIIWACTGIYYKRQYMDPQLYPVITTTAAAVVLLLVYRIFRLRKSFSGQRAY